MNHLSTPSSDSLPVTARGRRTRRRILEAAEAIFGERGYESASITHITQRAGVAQGSFYTYFPNKQAAFTELVRSLSDDLIAEVAEQTAGAPSRIEAERRGLVAFFQFTLKHQSLYRIVRQAEFVDEALYRAYYERIAAGYMRSVGAAMAAEELRELDVEAIAWSMMGIADFLGMRWVLWEGRLPPDSVIDSAIAMIRNGLTR